MEAHQTVLKEIGSIKKAKAQMVFSEPAGSVVSNVQLTSREAEVLQLICLDYQNKEIADMLCLSMRTVETHRRAMLQKTGAKTMCGLLLFAFRKGWISEEILAV